MESSKKRKIPIGLWLIFILVFTMEMLLGIYFAYIRDFVYYDAISRVANAFYVLYSRDPHLGAIGFVWNPLPSILELGPLLLWPVIPQVATSGLAANIITSLFAGGSAVLLFKHCRNSSLSKLTSLIITFGYVFNPFVFIYGANGMSEAMISFFVIWLIINLTVWVQEERPFALIVMSFLLALGFWIRYETIAVGVAIAASLAIIMLDRNREALVSGKGRVLYGRNIFSKIEATLIVGLGPAIFSGLVWMQLNSSIMGDPLYFFRSGYSNLAFAGNITSEFKQLISSPAGVLWLVLRKSFFFSLPLLSLLLVRLVMGYWRRWDTVILLLMVSSIPAMQGVMLYKGSSFGWLRFFVYPFVMTVAWLPYELSLLKSYPFNRLLTAFLLCSVLASSLVIYDMRNQSLSPDEYETFHIEESGTLKDMRIAQEVAQYTNQLFRESPPDKPLLMLTDSYSAYAVLLNSQYPRQWVITNDRNFPQILAHPQANGVNFLLVSKQKGSVLQVIHEMYPGLYEKGAEWVELEKDFQGEWRLFRVKPLNS